MNAAQFRAPQYGVFSTMPPTSDNPADASRPAKCPDLIALQLRALRNEAAERAAFKRRTAPSIFR